MKTDDTAQYWLRIIGWGFVVLGVLSALDLLVDWISRPPNTLIVNVSFLVWIAVGYGLLKRYAAARVGAMLLAGIASIGAPIAGAVMLSDLANVDVVLLGMAVTLSPAVKGVLLVGGIAAITAIAGGAAYVLSRPRVAQQFQ